MSTWLIDVPVRSYLGLYYQVQYKQPEWRERMDPLLNRVFFLHQPSFWPLPVFPSKTSVTISVPVPAALRAYSDQPLDDETIHRLEHYLDDDFDRSMIAYLDYCVANGMQIQDAIFAFVDQYNIGEDDLAFETAKKRYYRHRVPPKKPVRSDEPQSGQLLLFDMVA